MKNTKVKISTIVENQLPQFVQEQYPLASEFLSQYYKSLDSTGLPYDLISNIDEYIKLDNITNTVGYTTTTSSVDYPDIEIKVQSTEGFPTSYGLLKINTEIITYTGITTNSFTGCIRGFSGITSFRSNNTPDQLVFSESEIDTHSKNSVVENLSVLFLTEFYTKIKTQFLPGFEDRSFTDNLNKNIFLKQSSDFYSSKGTDLSFKLLFKALYGEKVEVIKPREFVINPSNAQYRITNDIIAESISGNPEDLVNGTLFQDQFENIDKAFGSVTKVERIIRNYKEYYIISLDSDFDKDINVTGSIFGNFSIHPKTKIISTVEALGTTLDVDSTVSFPSSGELSIVSSNGTNLTITYEGTTLNQFLNCSGINEHINSGTDISLNTVAYGYSDDTKIEIKITGVLSEVNIPENNFYYNIGDQINVKTLGYKGVNFKDNNWIFNVSTTNDVKDIISQGNSKYDIVTYDYNNVYNGDSVEVDFSVPSVSGRFISTFTATVNQSHIPNLSFQINALEKSFTSINKVYSVRKLVSKYNNLEYTTNVQNVYKESTNSKALYVASPSIPKYANLLNNQLDIKDYSITFTFAATGENYEIDFKNQAGAPLDHSFYTGDSIVYNPELYPVNERLNLSKGVYFVKKITSKKIKLARSRADIDVDRYIIINGNAVNNSFVLFKFANSNFSKNPLTSQKLIRKIEEPNNDGNLYDTPSGTTGILVNGVEILNYKSDDYVFYGPLEKIEVVSPGDDYDVISPPVLKISSGIGTDIPAEGICEVEGSLKRIDILDSGFDYLTEPTITILGGNGVGAKAKANMIGFDHFVDFNTSAAGSVNLTLDIIGFTTHHKFRDGEQVVYQTNKNMGIAGITTGSSYYVSILDATRVRLYSNRESAITANNQYLKLNSYGVGNHTLKSFEKKKKVNSISIVDPGSGYKNREVGISSSNIKVSSNTIQINDHRFSSGDIINYNTTGTAPTGLPEGKYYVTKIDDNNFTLSNVGIGTIQSDYYYKIKKYVDITTNGSGDHIFSYDPITLTVTGQIGVTTFPGQDFNCKLQPVVRGSIKSVFLKYDGVGYGSSDIINFNKQPIFSFACGKDAIVTPIISNRKIIQVSVDYAGEEYNCPPDLIITSSGIGAILTPVIENGKLSEVIVVNSGSGYDPNTTSITVSSAPKPAQLKANIKQWNVNLYKKILDSNSISNDGGVIRRGLNFNYGLQYTHLYCPNKLREMVFCQKEVGESILYKSDLQNDSDAIYYHSPIIGWAYDGNPIYGPYGYSNPDGSGGIRQLITGYKLNSSPLRPSAFSLGFFVEDYVYGQMGDLDEHNGRFCITPEYPNGTYAYFIGLNYLNKLPEFPYFIGNTYKSKPIDFNFDKDSNQDNFNLIENNVLRNTYPYNIDKITSTYTFVSNLDKIKNQRSVVKSILTGSVDNINIEFSGKDYKVGDKIIFDNEQSGGVNAKAEISHIKGRVINEINCSTIEISNVEFYPSQNLNEFIGFSPEPHNFNDGDFIRVDGLDSVGTNLQGYFPIHVKKDTLILSNRIQSGFITGLSTYFYVNGNLSYPNIRENDVFKIENEKVKIIGIDRESSRIAVLRGYDGTSYPSHRQGTYLIENPRKFTINVTSDQRQYNLNKELYFLTKESLAIGTSVGIVSTISFRNPGVGITAFNAPTKTMYLPGHKLPNNTQLIYNSNSGIGSVFQISSDGITTIDPLENSIFYSRTYSDDLIGISLNANDTNTVFFTGFGQNSDHSFKTVFPDVVKTNISKNVVTIITDTNHKLKVGDAVFVESNPGISTTIKIKYDSFNERLVVNPISFEYSDIDIINNTITILNHGYYTGQKVIYNSVNINELNDGSIYYIVVYDKNKIQLSDSFYNSKLKIPTVIDIINVAAGTISEVNPPINVVRNNKIIFDLSDPSLSKLVGSAHTTAFDFNIFTDSNFTNKLVGSGSSTTFEVKKYGNIGISLNARLELSLNSNLQNTLYYNLTPTLNSNVIVDDSYIKDRNSLNLINSAYSGSHTITGISTQSFTFNIYQNPEKRSYNFSEGNFSYYTNSKTEIGGIEKIKLSSGGRSYKKIPLIKDVASDTGSSALLFAESSSIGKISSFKILDIGFGYESDLTLRPTANLPQILKLDPLSSFDSIGITSTGVNYNIAPDLIVLDDFTRELVEDAKLTYSLGDSQVTILKNSKRFYGKNPIILPVNNSNGYRIRTMNYNQFTELVTVELIGIFTSTATFPFSVGDKVLIENTNVIESELRGFNSEEYGFALFEVVEVRVNGEQSLVIYSMDGYSNPRDIIGNYSIAQSAGRIIPEKYFPIFNPILVKNIFFENETVYSGNYSGIVQAWDEKNENLKITSDDIFTPNQLIFGKSSKSVGNIKKVSSTETTYKVSSTSKVERGWNSENGFLNTNTQRIHNNEYYQYFSYSLRSRVPYDTWKNSVSNLNHASGFQKFSDLIIESIDLTNVGIDANQNNGYYVSINTLNSVIDLDSVIDFDLAFESSFITNEYRVSDQIILNAAIIQDYSESVGNRVLLIDDISSSFSSKIIEGFVNTFPI
jgi:hypothetical protein